MSHHQNIYLRFLESKIYFYEYNFIKINHLADFDMDIFSVTFYLKNKFI